VYSCTPNTYIDEAIRKEILENGRTYAPPEQHQDDIGRKYKKQVKEIIGKVNEMMKFPPDARLRILSEESLSRHLLPVFDCLANARKVMIICGRNTAHGRLTPDGPVSAAVMAYTLFKCHKVAIIVCDEPNKRLIQTLLARLDPACAKYLKYLPSNEVNGRLVRKLSKELVTHVPDATLFIDVPGRNSDGDYLDENGEFISASNVAFDQALNIQNALNQQYRENLARAVEIEKAIEAIKSGKHGSGDENREREKELEMQLMAVRAKTANRNSTIALCRCSSNAGFPGDGTLHGSNGAENIGAVLRADHALLVPDIVTATLSLAELVKNACTDTQACTTGQLTELLDLAAELTGNRTLFEAPVVRKWGKPRAPWPATAASGVDAGHSRITTLAELHRLMDRHPIPWPVSFEKLKLDGPEERFVVLYDSSDGVLIAAEDFLHYVRARSNFHLKIHAVGDHANKPYGGKDDPLLTTLVGNGMKFCVTLRGEVIVMICNTACTVKLDRIKGLLDKWLVENGIYQKAEIINLIETVAGAIVEDGGQLPVLLATEQTAESGAYPEQIRKAAAKAGVEAPYVTVIGCGDRGRTNVKDWASYINDGAHAPGHRDHKTFLQEIVRYVEKCPLNATSIWLCCTHFPIIRDFIRSVMNDRLVAHGMELDSIPIIDPLSYQSEAMISYLVKNPLPPDSDHRALRDITVSTSGSYAEVKRSTELYITRAKAPVFDVVFPQLEIWPEEMAEGRPTP
jgi:glutamate racemase